MCHKNFIQHNGKKGDDDLNELKYESIIKMQKKYKQRSRLFVMDDAKARNIFHLNVVDLCLYIVGKSPIKIGLGIQSPQYGMVSALPIHVTDDDHALFVRKNSYGISQTLKDDMIQHLKNDLSREELIKLLKFMKFRVKDVQITQENKDILQEIESMDPYRDDTKILKAWFNDIFDGVCLITRILRFIEDLTGKKSAFCAPVLSQMYNELPELHTADVNVSYMVIVDDAYFPLSKKVSDNMNYPKSIDLDYVEVYSSTDKIEEIDERLILELPNADKTYKISLVQYDKGEEEQYRTRVIAMDDTIFDAMAIQLYLLSNSKQFNAWIDDRNLYLWKGRQERYKIKMLEKLKKLEEEIATLRNDTMDDNEL